MADTQDLGSCPERGESSTLSRGTSIAPRQGGVEQSLRVLRRRRMRLWRKISPLTHASKTGNCPLQACRGQFTVGLRHELCNKKTAIIGGLKFCLAHYSLIETLRFFSRRILGMRITSMPSFIEASARAPSASRGRMILRENGPQ